MVNTTVCPHCQLRGMLNLPYFYHDPDKQLALIFMPMETGRDHMERQQAIGRFTRAVMDSLPPEERKAYLLQPEVFLSQENLVQRILEADGVTQEMIDEQRAKADLLQRMVEAPSDEALEAMVKANDEAIDASFLRLVTLNLQMAQSRGEIGSSPRLAKVREMLLEHTAAGRASKARGTMLEALRAEPTREKLLDLLIQAPDERGREILVTFGRAMLDYGFFQKLTQRIERAGTEEEKERLTELRKQVLDIRDQIDAEARAVYEARAQLLRDLLLSEDPEKLARHRFNELDQVFLNILGANIDQAEAANNQETLESLREIWEMVAGLIQEATPPELVFLNELMSAEDEEEVEQILRDNPDMVDERLIEILETTQESMREEDDEEAAAHLAMILGKTRTAVAA